MFSLKKYIHKQIQTEFIDVLPNMVRVLDPKKSYILVIPLDVDFNEMNAALHGLGGNINIVLIQSDNMKLIEFE
jgi:hypothetical protein